MQKLRYSCKILVAIFLLSGYARAITIGDLIKLVDRNNLDILAQKHRVKMRKFQEKSTFREFLPYVYLSTSSELFYPYGTYGKSWEQKYSYGLSVGFSPVDFQRNIQLDIDRFYIDYEVESLSEKRLDEYLKAIKYFIRLKGWSDKINFRKERLESAKSIYSVSLKKKQEGKVLLSDVLKAKAGLEKSKKDYEVARNEFSKVENILREIVNVDCNVDLSPDIDLKESFNLPPEDEILDFAVKERPSIKKLKNKLKVSRSGAVYEKRALYPKLSLSASYSRTDYYWPPDNNYWNLGVSVKWKIFDSGVTGYKVMMKLEESEISKIELKKEVNRVKRQVLNSLSDFKSALSNIVSAREYLRFAKRSYERTFKEYKLGVSDIVSLLTAFDEFKKAYEQYVDNLVDLNIAYFEVLRYSGLLLKGKGVYGGSGEKAGFDCSGVDTGCGGKYKAPEEEAPGSG